MRVLFKNCFDRFLMENICNSTYIFRRRFVFMHAEKLSNKGRVEWKLDLNFSNDENRHLEYYSTHNRYIIFIYDYYDYDYYYCWLYKFTYILK